MLSTMIGCLMLIISLATVLPTMHAQWSVPSWLTFGIYTLIAFPRSTHQWSFLGLNFWPNQTVEKPSNEFDLIGNPISKVLDFFPTPVQEECLSQDKRRQGVCMNTYECRIQRGKSLGRCALGFGVCCIFTASCEQEVQNNLTYVISPGFPNLIDWPMNCSVVVRKIDRQVSQLRIDFVHFNIGQPNSRTGVCDEDIMEIRNGRSIFHMCGWNSGQHLYIDMDEDDQPLTLQFRLPAGLQSRMWEMRIVQLDFEQRAPTGCLQYFEGNNGTLKSLNFLSNGRFLANQDYLLCIRQERGMCGISYSPCSPDSFRIGPSRMQSTNRTNANASLAESSHGTNFTEKNSTDTGSMNVTDNEGSGSNSMDDFLTSMNTSNPMEQEADSSGGSTVYGQERCRDRVLIPCDFEEFITPGNNEAGICNLEHCGNSLCDRNQVDEEGNCRVETWATPFRIRVAFGPGEDTGTTLEDNIGMCLVYEQLSCMA
ncbi:hypothetical protein HZU67_09495 [Apis mellifera carnica]|uniref:Uncharacterized protein LOC724645 isoform X1 n=1 Tax=Apis mellifera TaxID=7460 RepID=A0A7M7GSU5_APIME|nr:uncharacterized protein LOC724645 isoform X1 [Apis mellifera]KAG9429120.1 hypothetical protein HZU67_09495 [Apis mellifera carnica]|eukprot:XP_006565068.1 uncharacterized protein LOC724645 isoform X1 [Apis mellifera]